LAINKAFEGDNSPLQNILLNLTQTEFPHGTEFAKEKVLEKIHAKLRNNEEIGDYSNTMVNML
jgi:hypothetical protein